AGPAIALVRLARHQSLGFESIHGRGDRSAGELDAPADLVDRLRSFVEQHLHHREVGEADPGGLDAEGRQSLERPMRFHDDEPDVRAGGVGGLPWCRGALHEYILTSRYTTSRHAYGGSRQRTRARAGGESWDEARARPLGAPRKGAPDKELSSRSALQSASRGRARASARDSTTLASARDSTTLAFSPRLMRR